MTDNGMVEFKQKGEQEERTFSQQEVDEIVKNRLARERKKAGTGEDARSDKEKSLEARELRLMAREKLLDTGMPSKLADILKYTDEESLDAALAVIKELNLNNSKAPKTKNWGERHGAKGSYDAEALRIREAMGLNRK